LWEYKREDLFSKQAEKVGNKNLGRKIP
jgi:hypothetical protein